MFENLIGQDRVAGALREQILDGRLPRAILFHGPRYAGKLTAALETARALSCRSDDARWACTCQSCTRHRVLMDPYTLLLGPRYFLEEIRVCSSGFLQGDSEPTRYLLLRS